MMRPDRGRPPPENAAALAGENQGGAHTRSPERERQPQHSTGRQRYYRLYDPERRGGMVEIPRSELRYYSDRKHAIYASVNAFAGPRQEAYCTRVCGWAVDIDSGTKPEQWERIQQSPLEPSTVVETKNGHHVHWYADDTATIDMYRPIVRWRLVPFFDGDTNAADVCRVLRVPGYYHWKDPNDPFLVRRVSRSGKVYGQADMLAAFPDRKPAPKPRPARTPASFPSGDSFWHRAHELDCLYALERLSGHWLVGGETIECRPGRNGKYAIWCNGKPTSCWVDEHGKIGSADKGGPSIVRWCLWYGHDYKAIAQGLKEVFAHELREERRRCA